MLSRNPTSRWLGPILIGLAQPAAAATGGWTGSDLIAVLLLALLALLAGWLVGRRTALRSDDVLPAAMDSDQRLKWALWGSGDSFWIWEVVDDVLSWSSASPMLGFDRHTSMKGRNWRERVIHREDSPRVEAAIAAHLGGQATQYEVEYRLRDASGAWNWVRARGRVVARDGKLQVD